jgi:hypothetical protein
MIMTENGGAGAKDFTPFLCAERGQWSDEESADASAHCRYDRSTARGDGAPGKSREQPMRVRRGAVRLLVVFMLTWAVAGVQRAAAEKGAWLFAYFHEPANQGVYFALSRDGLHYTPLNDDQPWIKPEVAGEIMRDAFLTRGPDHRFHLVWTWGWHVNAMGYASSPDLVAWSAHKRIAIMAPFPETNNMWAPEIYYDKARAKWLVIWASAAKEAKDRHRLWSSFTADFSDFTKPEIFFDPGYTVIDQTIFAEKGKPFRLIFKQQTKDPLTYQERVATGPTLEGPWSAISEPINEPWSEGPSAIKLGGRYVVFYDHYRGDHIRYEAVATRDWKHWVDMTEATGLPKGAKHGSFLWVTEAEAQRLLARHDRPSTTPAQ